MKKKIGKLDQKARQMLMKEWNARVRYQPPAVRLQWLQSAEGLVAHGARQRDKLSRKLLRLRERIERLACSEEWMEGLWDRGDPWCVKHLARSKARVRYGAPLGPDDAPNPKRRGNSYPHRRLTPKPAVEVEDEIDSLTHGQAAAYDRPPSPSALAIRRIGLMKGRELSNEELARRASRRREKRRILSAGPSLSNAEILDSIEDAANQGDWTN